MRPRAMIRHCIQLAKEARRRGDRALARKLIRQGRYYQSIA